MIWRLHLDCKINAQLFIYLVRIKFLNKQWNWCLNWYNSMWMPVSALLIIPSIVIEGFLEKCLGLFGSLSFSCNCLLNGFSKFNYVG